MHDAQDIAISPDGATVYVSAYADDAVVIFQRNSTTGALTYSATLINGVNGVSGINGAKSLVVSPDNAHVYVASLSDSAIAVFARNNATGALTSVEVQRNGVNGVTGLGDGHWRGGWAHWGAFTATQSRRRLALCGWVGLHRADESRCGQTRCTGGFCP